MSANDNFDRSKPVYRCFDLREEADGRDKVWYWVDATNMPSRALTPPEVEVVEFLVDTSPWKEAFWEAYAKNKKATIYDPML